MKRCYIEKHQLAYQFFTIMVNFTILQVYNFTIFNQILILTQFYLETGGNTSRPESHQIFSPILNFTENGGNEFS